MGVRADVLILGLQAFELNYCDIEYWQYHRHLLTIIAIALTLVRYQYSYPRVDYVVYVHVYYTLLTSIFKDSPDCSAWYCNINTGTRVPVREYYTVPTRVQVYSSRYIVQYNSYPYTCVHVYYSTGLALPVRNHVYEMLRLAAGIKVCSWSHAGQSKINSRRAHLLGATTTRACARQCRKSVRICTT